RTRAPSAAGRACGSRGRPSWPTPSATPCERRRRPRQEGTPERKRRPCRRRFLGEGGWFHLQYRQHPGRPYPPAGLEAGSLFAPRISVVGVAETLPEAWLIGGDELEARQPFGALPEVARRDEEAHRSAVLRGERLAVGVVTDHRVVLGEGGKREVRGELWGVR